MKTLEMYLRILHKQNELTKEEYNTNEDLTESLEQIR